MVDLHQKFLREVKKQGKRVFSEQRRNIIYKMQQYLKESHVSRCLTYKEKCECWEYLSKQLSLETLIGFKQLSIFDEIPDDYFTDKNA